MKRPIFLLVPLALILLGAGCAKKESTPVTTETNSAIETQQPNENSSTTVSWRHSGDGWVAAGTPPECPDPLVLETPVDLSAVTSMLYPGQTRGGDFKPHGGFRFDNAADNQVTVRAPLDATVVEGSRYIEQGETQYLFDFIVPCGIRYRFDHLLVLSPSFAALAERLPAARVDDSRTTRFDEPVTVTAGEIIATSVGFAQNTNVFFDLGVYDLRTENEASRDATWVSQHAFDAARHAVCWFDWLSATDEAMVRGLPAGDSTSGLQSDYCQ